MPISVIMPAHNAESYLAEAIESVLAQTWKDFELYVLDDGSRDRTREIAASYAVRDPRIHVESHANMGVAPTLNRGLALATSEWVVLMHADDVMMPNRIERQLEFVAAHPELAVASSWIMNIDSKGRVIAKGNSQLTTHEAVQARYKANQLIGFSAPATMIRKSAALAIGGFRPQFRVGEDFDMWNRLLENNCKILVQPEYLLKYRVHASSASVAQARLISQQLHWYKDSMLRRRRGEQELSWDEYQCYRKTLPWYVKVNEARKDTAKVFYKAAAFYFAQRKYHLLLPAAAIAVLLKPGYSIRQMLTKLSIWPIRRSVQ